MTSKVDIRLATSSEGVAILSEPQLVAALPPLARIDLLRYVTDTVPDHYVAKQGKHSCIFRFWPKHNGMYEFHIACPKASIPASRVLAKAIMLWVFVHLGDECKGLITNCPEGKIANFCRKLGGKQILKKKGTVYFVINKEILYNIIKS